MKMQSMIDPVSQSVRRARGMWASLLCATALSGLMANAYALTTNAGFSGMETFTSTGTWTAPPLLDLQSVNHVQVILCGGGGGGVANQFQFSSGSGGGGVLAVLPVTPGETYTINIGAAGTSSPSDGGDTFFAASNGAVLAVAYGGGAGTAGRGGSGGPVARNVAVVAGQTAPGVSTPGAASALCATYAPRGSGAGGGFNANGGPGWAAVIW